MTGPAALPVCPSLPGPRRRRAPRVDARARRWNPSDGLLLEGASFSQRISSSVVQQRSATEMRRLAVRFGPRGVHRCRRPASGRAELVTSRSGAGRLSAAFWQCPHCSAATGSKRSHGAGSLSLVRVLGSCRPMVDGGSPAYRSVSDRRNCPMRGREGHRAAFLLRGNDRE